MWSIEHRKSSFKHKYIYIYQSYCFLYLIQFKIELTWCVLIGVDWAMKQTMANRMATISWLVDMIHIDWNELMLAMVEKNERGLWWKKTKRVEWSNDLNSIHHKYSVDWSYINAQCKTQFTGKKNVLIVVYKIRSNYNLLASHWWMLSINEWWLSNIYLFIFSWFGSFKSIETDGW